MTALDMTQHSTIDGLDAEIKKVVDKIAREFAPEKIILFGSHAWGQPAADSDIDLCIVKETENTREMAREIDGALFPRKLPLDIVVYTPTGLQKSIAEDRNLFLEDIVTNGQVVYEAD